MDTLDILLVFLFLVLAQIYAVLYTRWYIKRRDLRRMGELSNENIYDIYAWISENDITQSRVYFEEADAVIDRYIAALSTSKYVLNALWEIKCQLEEQQETQSL